MSKLIDVFVQKPLVTLDLASGKHVTGPVLDYEAGWVWLGPVRGTTDTGYRRIVNLALVESVIIHPPREGQA